MRQKFDWGPSIPYNITGQMNLHPRTRHGLPRGRRTPDDYVGFYDQTMAEF